MAKSATPATTEATAPKRKMLTPAERVAKLEADLAAAKAKAEAKSNKARDEAHARRAKLVEKRDKLNEQIASIDEQFPQATPVTDEPAEA